MRGCVMTHGANSWEGLLTHVPAVCVAVGCVAVCNLHGPKCRRPSSKPARRRTVGRWDSSLLLAPNAPNVRWLAARLPRPTNYLVGATNRRWTGRRRQLCRPRQASWRPTRDCSGTAALQTYNGAPHDSPTTDYIPRNEVVNQAFADYFPAVSALW